MSYRYVMTFSDLEELLSNPAGIAIAGMGLLVAFVVLACFVVMYVFQSIGLYTIAKRRGIANPGLAWVPVAYSWILGSVSDQYQYVVRGKVCNRRKILLGLAIAGFFLGQSGVLFLANYTTVLDAFDWDAFYFGVGVGRSAVATLAGLVAAALAVYQYISLYDVYQSCNPQNSVVFLVLSVVFPFLTPFFLFADRNQERGMPPRRDSVPPEQGPQAPQWEAKPSAEEPWRTPDQDHPVEP